MSDLKEQLRQLMTAAVQASAAAGIQNMQLNDFLNRIEIKEVKPDGKNPKEQ